MQAECAKIYRYLFNYKYPTSYGGNRDMMILMMIQPD